MTKKQLQGRINHLNGDFTLAGIMSSVWDDLPGKNILGRQFKQMVKQGKFDNITYAGETSDHHAVYTIAKVR